MSTSEYEGKPRFMERLSSLLQRWRLFLLILLIAVLVGLVAYFVWTEVQSSAREKSTVWAERAENLEQQWLAESDAAKKQSLQKELTDLLARILSRYPRQYAAQRALFIRADMAYQTNDWAKAADSYRALAGRFPRSYLVQLSLDYAGICYENLGDDKQALAAYQRLRDRYKNSYLVPHVLFSIGRILESEGDYPGALKAYNLLDDEHPESAWTRMSRNRIIQLKIEGKVPQ
jgi:tetratricopeptide (TPR) repeat protein